MSANEHDGTGPFAIYRTAKITTLGQLGASAAHMMRTIPTPNADPSRAHLNRAILGSDDPAADVRALLPDLGERNEDGHLLRRKNSVLAIEILLTMSPEWWDAATKPDREDWLRRSVDWLKAEYGPENVAALRFHGDERTGHLTGYIVPRDPETGALNARRWTGGGWRLSEQQDAYAEAMAPTGLKRGIRGSTATHEAVRRFYGALALPVAKPEVPVPPRVILSPQDWAEEATRQMTTELEPVVTRARTAGVEQTKRKAAQAQATKDRARAERAESRLASEKAVADRLRALDLARVLDALGFEQDPREKIRWKAEGFNITLGEGAKIGKWWDHASQKGRGGAIDLVAHVMGTDFKSSVAWLASRFGEGAAAADLTAQLRRQAVAQVKEAVAERDPFTPPAPAPEHWPGVRRHLVEDRALPAPYIDKLHQQGDCYADARRNAVFVCRDEDGQAVGAELKGTVQRQDGTRFTGMAPGSRKDRGGFRVGSVARAAVVYLVESAIDAISLIRLRALDGEKGIAVVSTAGTTPEPRRWFEGLADTVRRVCAFDNDPVGDKAAQALRRHRFERLRPEGKDWNDDLRARRAAAGGQGAAAPAVPAARPSAARKPPEPLDEGPSMGPGF
ncbi:MAG: plasmid recombination protein [Thioclava sp.]|nr:MobV family relaxase [Thioclava sp.]MBD3805170.1 plasmid recombination protein [Thioclava sp.]